MERKENTKYSREFKLEAVRLAAIGDRPKTQIARELGIRVNKLRYWRLEFKQGERVGAPILKPFEAENIDFLRNE